MREGDRHHAQAAGDAVERGAFGGGLRCRLAHAAVTLRRSAAIAASAPIAPHFSTMPVNRIS